MVWIPVQWLHFFNDLGLETWFDGGLYFTTVSAFLDFIRYIFGGGR